MELIEPVIQILFINLLLSGDNAIVIAMASRHLPEHLQGKAIRWGTFAAIGLRILFTFLMMYLLHLPFIQFIGGMLLLMIAYNLLVDKPEEKNIKGGESLRSAVTIIIFADLVMSLDNVLAIAAIADSNMLLIIAGVILSIPIILYASELILIGIQKYPIIIYIGAGLLAWTAGEMILKENLFHASKAVELLFLNGITIAILLVGGVRRNSVPK